MSLIKLVLLCAFAPTMAENSKKGYMCLFSLFFYLLLYLMRQVTLDIVATFLHLKVHVTAFIRIVLN